jgi:hypothetical protein
VQPHHCAVLAGLCTFFLCTGLMCLGPPCVATLRLQLLPQRLLAKTPYLPNNRSSPPSM